MNNQVLKGLKTPKPMAHYCQGVLHRNTIYAAGQIASDYQTGVAPEAKQDPAFPYYGSDIQKQARYILQNLQSVFESAGSSFNDVVKSQVFLKDLNDFYYFDQVWKEFFPSPPPRTTVEIGGLLVPGCKVEIDLWGVQAKVPRQVIIGKKTPTPMAHYSQGILIENVLYAAGQIASDYQTGVAAEAKQDPAFPYYGSDIQKQTRYILSNIQSVFDAAGCDFKDVVKAQIFLTDLNDFYYFDQVWQEFFQKPVPRTIVEVQKLLVPGCRIEIDLWGVLPNTPKREITLDGDNPQQSFCNGVIVNDTLYASGQIASDHQTPMIQVAHQDPAFPYYGSEIQKQTRYVLSNLKKLYHEGGFDLADTVKAQVFLSDLNDFYYFDQIWKEYFPSPPPRTTLEVGKFLVPGCKVQVDLTAAKP